MSNFIINGDFSDNFNHWDNGVGGYPYAMKFEMAQAGSIPDSTDSRTFKMKQQFIVNDEVIAAKLTAWGQWLCFSGEVDGYVRFIIELEKPDISKVTLLDETKTPPSGEGNLLDEEDITAHFAQYGNYQIWLTCEPASSLVNSGPPPVYATSFAYYDNINLNVTVKKYKSVHEKMGGSGDFTAGKAYFETASDMMGLVESYTHSTTKRFWGVAESMGLLERIQAKRTRGNLETTYVLEDLTQWTEISRVETPWIKIKTEIS